MVQKNRPPGAIPGDCLLKLCYLKLNRTNPIKTCDCFSIWLQVWEQWKMKGVLWDWGGCHGRPPMMTLWTSLEVILQICLQSRKSHFLFDILKFNLIILWTEFKTYCFLCSKLQILPEWVYLWNKGFNLCLFNFTDSVSIVPNGIHFTFSGEGRPSGECFVELQTPDDVELAVTRHKDHMGQRYIEGKHI